MEEKNTAETNYYSDEFIDLMGRTISLAFRIQQDGAYEFYNANPGIQICMRCFFRCYNQAKKMVQENADVFYESYAGDLNQTLHQLLRLWQRENNKQLQNSEGCSCHTKFSDT